MKQNISKPKPKRFKNYQLMGRVLKRTGAIQLVWGYITVFFSISMIMFFIEPGIKTFGDGIWYCFSVMSTIGFGDITAVTRLGRILSIVLSLYSILLVAIVPGVLTSYYVELIHLRANESAEQFLHELEHLPELSQEELTSLSERAKQFQKNNTL